MTTYADLGRLIDRERPYGESGTLPDLTDPTVFDSRKKAQASSKDRVDIFGPLVDYGQTGVNGILPVRRINPVNEPPMVVVAGDNPYQPIETGAFHVMLNNGEEFRITKGIRIPYTYNDDQGNQIWANILILYNGVGNP